MIRKNKLVLYVDDTEEQRYAMRRILEREGYRILEASTGAEALTLLRPDLMLVILDVRLPDMNGFDVCRRIKSDPAFSLLPVIQVSASFVDPELRAKGLLAGADAYIAQPVHPQELLNLTRSLIRSNDAERMLSFLASIGPQINRSLELAETLAAIRTASTPFADHTHIVLFDAPDSGVTDSPPLSALLNALAKKVIGERASQLRSPQELDNPDLSVIGVPLHFGANLLGAVLFVLDKGERTYQQSDIVYAEDLADRFALAIQNAKLYTSQQTAHEALVQSEKLAAAARLSAAIAHELNNPLEAVMNLVYLIETSPGVPTSAVGYAQEALSELQRLSHIARQSLGFYRELTTAQTFDLSENVADTLRLYSLRFSSKDIRIEAEYAPVLPVRGIKGEIRQVISNVLVNALDAVPKNGEIRIRTWSTPEREAVVSIHNSGAPIPEAVLPRIFEPFFTTKEGTGTGLGLWVSQNIIHKHGGRLQVKSREAEPDSGSTFSIVLPLA